MARTIEERIVDLNLNNKGFEQGAQQSIKTIDTLKSSLNFTGAAKGLGEIDRAARNVDLSNISSGVDTIKNKFSIMGAVAFTIIQDLTRKAVDLGKKLVDSIILDPTRSGFEEYELKMGSIQTIMAGTGESLETVNRYLGELNEYADKTIYSFADMTQNIGKFTNAGVSLEGAVAAIKGVANVAALSGANSNEASRAMYNFAQALSAGHVKLIDWKSIELANMGTKEFKQQLIDTAVAVGTLEQQADGMYKTLEGKLLNSTQGFNESLTDAWMTTDVLVGTLNRYSDASTDIGSRATAAAQDVKTYSMLIDTLKEAAQSGWAVSWEWILGDFNQAKALFTELSDLFGGMIGTAADARNAVLEEWSKLGGRTRAIEAFRAAFAGVQNVLATFKSAMREIFPALTGFDLYLITDAVAKFAEKFKMASENLDGLKKVFKAFFALLDIGKMAIKAIAKVLGGWLVNLKPLSTGLSGGVSSLADFILTLRENIKEHGFYTDSMKQFVEKVGVRYQELKVILDKLRVWFENAKTWVKEGIEKISPQLASIKTWFSKAKDWVREGLKNIDLSAFGEFFAGLNFNLEPLTAIWRFFVELLKAIGKIIVAVGPIFVGLARIVGGAVTKFFDAISGGLENFDPQSVFQIINSGLLAGTLLAVKNFVTEGTGVFGGVVELLEGVGGSLKAWQDNLKANILTKIAASLLMLAIAIFIIGSIDSNRVESSLGAVTLLLVELFAAMKAFSSVSTGIGGVATMTAGLMGLAASLLVISLAIKLLSGIEPEPLSRGLLAITAVIGLLRGAAQALGKTSGKAILGALALQILAGALIVISAAVFAMGSMNIDTLKQGLLSIGLTLLMLVGFIRLTGGQRGILGAAAGIMILAQALLVLVAPIFLLGSMKPEELGQGIIALATSLTIIALAMRLMPKNMIITGVALMIVSEALLIIAGVMKLLGSMDQEAIGRGLIALGGALIIIAAGLYAMTGTLAGSAALFVASAALLMLAPALKMLGNMSLKEIGIGLLAIAGTFTVLGLAALLLTPLIPALMGLSVALLIFGAAALLTGVGILALATGLGMLAVSGGAGIAVLVAALSAMIGLIPFFVQQIGNALIALVVTIAEGAPILIEAIIEILWLLIEGVGTLIPPLIELILELVVTLLQKLAEKTPDIVQAGLDMLIGLLDGIANNIFKVVDAAFRIVEEFLRALGEKIPDLVDAGFDMIIGIIEGITKAVDEKLPRIIQSVKKLGKAIIDGILKGITGNSSSVLNSIADLAKGAIDTFKAWLGIGSPSREFFTQAKFIVMGLVGGIQKFAEGAYSAVKDFGGGLVDRFQDASSKLSDIINSEVDISPVITPVFDLSSVKPGASKLRTLLNDTDLSIGISGKGANAIAVGMDSANGANSNQIPAIGVQYNQYNTSPKALTHHEIYRQTRNALLATKGDMPV